MLELKDIKKEYAAGDTVVHALKGVSLKFRRSEFVSILGPSGCGKTTMLNIIGGLDKYTSGDLVINGRSTKDFKDRDWDTYRNHSIGFVFQSYNLIPHQTVLQNVELALTLSGVSKNERRERAKKALEEVGLGNQLTKRPNEMSGGQMQRVAIARALVNNPDIILADEPTGALDSETSVQVMEILKKISNDRLIVMVTHNPELAEQYSSRIIRVLDGEILSDSMPLTDEEVAEEKKLESEMTVSTKKPSMSFFTSFNLSLKNLFTKKGRTILTSFAGSIGIIGIALILSISQGLTTYIDMVQEQTLSTYPLTIQKTEANIGALMETFMGISEGEGNHEMDAVYTKSSIYEMLNALNNIQTTENDLKAFKKYLEDKRSDKESDFAKALNGIHYSYDLDMLVYTKNIDNQIIRSDATELLQEVFSEVMGMDMSAMMSVGGSGSSAMMMGGGSSSGSSVWQEMLDGDDGKAVNALIKKQYDVVYGDWPNSYNEVVLVLDENNEIDDMTLYTLGLTPKDNVKDIMNAAMKGTDIELEQKSWSYKEICDMDFRVILNADCYVYDEVTGRYNDLRDTDAGLQYLYDNAEHIKVVGIIKPNPDATAHMLRGSIAYTTKLTEYVVNASKESKAIAAQLKSEDKDVITGLPFKVDEKLDADQKAEAFKGYIKDYSVAQKAKAYVAINSIPSQEMIDATVAQTMGAMTVDDMRATMLQGLVAQMGLPEEQVAGYIQAMSDEEIKAMFTQMIEEQVKAQYAETVAAQMAATPVAQLAAAFDELAKTFTNEQCAAYYDEIIEFSENTYEQNLKSLGYVDLEEPMTINLFASSFENKDIIVEAIDEYNKGKEELEQIKYTDYIGLMMSSITTIINAITYVLIAFVAISLVVSSIMIGVITLISVQERTKEIGILRAIGASKKNVSNMFNAETIIIGFTSGLLGVVVTYILCIPINIIIHKLTDIYALNAYLPIPAAIILILISVFLTLISGIIPSRSAAKKDPVVALRTE